MLFVTIRSASAAEVPKVLQVVEHTKRLRHKAGRDEEQELYQYVVYDTERPKGPRRIKLDDPAPAPHMTYAPPTSLSVHLSKIDMPELKPKAAAPPRSEPPPVVISPEPSGKGKKGLDKPPVAEKQPRKSSAAEKREEREREKERLREVEREKEREREREKAQRKAEKEAKKAEKNKKGVHCPSFDDLDAYMRVQRRPPNPR